MVKIELRDLDFAYFCPLKGAGLPGVPAAPGCQGGARRAGGLGPGAAGAGRPNPKAIPMCQPASSRGGGRTVNHI